MPRPRAKNSSIVTLLAIAALAAGLAACGGEESTEAVGPGDLQTSTPPGEGEVDQVTWNLLREPTSVDPIKSQTEAESPVTANMCESLLTVDNNFKLQPGLAESYEQVKPTEWVYKIRRGVRFWNGRPLTAADVVYSLKRSFSLKSGSYWPTYFDRVKAVRETAQYEVTIDLHRPDALLNRELATSGGAVVDRRWAAATGAAVGTPKVGVMCSGHFKFDSWTPGNQIQLSRNTEYWDDSRVPLVERLIFKFIQNEATATSALLSGEIDGMYEAPPSSVTRLRDARNGTLRLGPSTGFLIINSTETSVTNGTPLNRALSMALNRQAIAKTIFKNAARPLKSIAPPTFGYAEDVFNEYYESTDVDQEGNVDAAKKIVDRAGAPDRPIKLAVFSSPTTIATANEVQATGEKIGLPITVEVLSRREANSLYFDPKLRGAYDMFFGYTYTNNADPLEFLVYFTPQSYYNYAKYDNPEFTGLVNKARGIYDDDERAKVVTDAYSILDHDMPWIPLVYQPERLFMSNELTGATPSFSYIYQAWAARLGRPGSE